MPRGRPKYNVKPTLHSTEHKRLICGTYSLVRGSTVREFSFAISSSQNVHNVDVCKLIARQIQKSEHDIFLESEPFIVVNPS